MQSLAAFMQINVKRVRSEPVCDSYFSCTDTVQYVSCLEGLVTVELCPNSSLAGYQAVLTLDMLGFSYCHIECQDLIQM